MAIHPNSLKNLKSWRKGQSGNPGGRPKGENVSEHLLRLGQEYGGTAGGKKITHSEVIARGILLAACDKKDPYHAEAVRIYLDRTEGKALERVAQQIDISGGAIVPRAIIPTEETKEAKKTP